MVDFLGVLFCLALGLCVVDGWCWYNWLLTRSCDGRFRLLRMSRLASLDVKVTLHLGRVFFEIFQVANFHLTIGLTWAGSFVKNPARTLRLDATNIQVNSKENRSIIRCLALWQSTRCQNSHCKCPSWITHTHTHNHTPKHTHTQPHSARSSYSLISLCHAILA